MLAQDMNRRIETLREIEFSVKEGRSAIADRDFEKLEEIAARRRRLFAALKAIDATLSGADETADETPDILEIGRRARALLAKLIHEEALLREELADWLGETRGEVIRVRQQRRAGASYRTRDVHPPQAKRERSSP